MMRLTSVCTVGALQRAARLGLDRRGKIGVLDLLVAFECDAVEHGRFGQVHDEPFAAERSIETLSNRPVAISAFNAASREASSNRPSGAA